MDECELSVLSLQTTSRQMRYELVTQAGTPAGGGGTSATPKPKKIVVEKWCYFPELYKMTKVREEGIENG